ncbi:MAG: hypothetical protein CMM07_13520 [Rhodopirellula sp.]|nr:hypothetical protein [Rhodopirellula sp.]
MSPPDPTRQQSQPEHERQLQQQIHDTGDEPVAILAALLTNRHLRNRLRETPEEIAEQWSHQEHIQTFLLQLDLNSLTNQAESLISKRRGEVAKRIPSIWAFLGQSAPGYFSQYVDQSAWPRGYRRSLLDAISFCNYLQSLQLPGLPLDERRWLRFQNARSRFRVGLVSGVHINGRPRLALQMLSRSRGGKPGKRHFYLRHWTELLAN